MVMPGWFMYIPHAYVIRILPGINETNTLSVGMEV